MVYGLGESRVFTSYLWYGLYSTAITMHAFLADPVLDEGNVIGKTSTTSMISKAYAH
jgi:hypothetical protein